MLEKKSMRILGIDPGSYNTGYGLIRIEQKNEQYIESGVWKPKRNKPFLERAKFLHKYFSLYLEKMRPDILVLEEAFSGIFPKAGLQLSQIRGIFMAEAFRNSIPIIEYSTKQVKQNLTGYGAAEKSQINFMVKKILNLQKILDVDEADALALCVTYLQNGALAHSAVENFQKECCFILS